MPFKDAEAKAAYDRKWREKNLAWRRKTQREARLKKLDHYKAMSEKNNRKRGFPARAKGPRAEKRVTVPRIRKYVFIEDRVYFNRETGFTVTEIAQLLIEFRGEDQAAVQKNGKSKAKSRKP